jgi:hypothetical protein
MDGRFVRNVVVKGLVLFLVLDLLFAAINPTGLGRLSLYNHLFPGRARFPFGEDSSQSYNLSLFNLDAMFASHIISGSPKPADEFRVIVIGDSSTWGTLLRPEQTLAGQLDAMGINLCGKTVRVYNLGYPTISLTKDLMVLDYAMRYKPDLVIWPFTLEAFPVDKQLTSPLVANNAGRVERLIEQYGLPFNPSDPTLVSQNFWDRTIFGQRRSLADLFRLQMYGVMWAATGVDQVYPTDYARAQLDFNTDISFHGKLPETFDPSSLAYDVLSAGLKVAGGTPVILVNEPMLISTGQNSNLRYNFYYPRWVYDQYRQTMIEDARSFGWNYLDLWNSVPEDQFTNSAIHLTPTGEMILASHLKPIISHASCP